MKNYKIKNIGLAAQGKLKIEFAERHMPVLMSLRERFSKEKPFKGINIAACLHITKESAVLIRTLAAGGANVALTACNPLSTQDDVAASLAQDGYHVYGWRGINSKEYYENINFALDIKPNVIIDDACDLIFTVHTKRQELISGVIGACEETTSGVIRLRAMEKEGALKFPTIAVNDADTKHLFDNRYGTGQSTFDGVIRATNILIAGKKVVIAGYGWCGRGVAVRAKGLGAHVIVTEVDNVKALEAVMDGYEVMPMKEAAKLGDLFITVTGDKHVIRGEHFEKMKDGAIVCNSGHFNIEINIPELEKLSKSQKEIRPNNVEYTLKNGKKIYLLAEGRLVNLSAAEGHPSEVMDMSFSTQALSSIYILENKDKLEAKVYDAPAEQAQEISAIKLNAIGVKIDKLTKEQIRYLSSWQEGT